MSDQDPVELTRGTNSKILGVFTDQALVSFVGILTLIIMVVGVLWLSALGSLQRVGVWTNFDAHFYAKFVVGVASLGTLGMIAFIVFYIRMPKH